MQGLGQEARDILGRARWALLSTHSVKEPGFPFGSVIPVLWDAARGVLLTQASGLAEHTHNLKADGRCSVMVMEGTAGNADLQASARMTVMARAVPVTGTVDVDAWLAAHPQAKQLMGMKDFGFWELAPVRARLVAGFGKMGWLGADELKG